MTVTTTWPTTGSSCTPSPSLYNNPGNRVKVTVTYRYSAKIAFVATIPLITIPEKLYHLS
ncbi:MAG: hypothetical protein ACRD3N_16805 [Terracidiphilus sp.]